MFYAAYDLEEDALVSQADLDELNALHRWFMRNMFEPETLAISSRHNAKAQALSWFKETATEHVSQMRRFQSVLEKYGRYVETLRTSRPGYVVYEDDVQVVAYPFADTPT